MQADLRAQLDQARTHARVASSLESAGWLDALTGAATQELAEGSRLRARVRLLVEAAEAEQHREESMQLSAATVDGVPSPLARAWASTAADAATADSNSDAFHPGRSPFALQRRLLPESGDAGAASTAGAGSTPHAASSASAAAAAAADVDASTEGAAEAATSDGDAADASGSAGATAAWLGRAIGAAVYAASSVRTAGGAAISAVPARLTARSAAGAPGIPAEDAAAAAAAAASPCVPSSPQHRQPPSESASPPASVSAASEASDAPEDASATGDAAARSVSAVEALALGSEGRLRGAAVSDMALHAGWTRWAGGREEAPGSARPAGGRTPDDQALLAAAQGRRPRRAKPRAVEL